MCSASGSFINHFIFTLIALGALGAVCFRPMYSIKGVGILDLVVPTIDIGLWDGALTCRSDDLSVPETVTCAALKELDFSLTSNDETSTCGYDAKFTMVKISVIGAGILTFLAIILGGVMSFCREGVSNGLPSCGIVSIGLAGCGVVNGVINIYMAFHESCNLSLDGVDIPKGTFSLSNIPDTKAQIDSGMWLIGAGVALIISLFSLIGAHNQNTREIRERAIATNALAAGMLAQQQPMHLGQQQQFMQVQPSQQQQPMQMQPGQQQQPMHAFPPMQGGVQPLAPGQHQQQQMQLQQEQVVAPGCSPAA